MAVVPVDGGRPVALARADMFTRSPRSNRIAYATSGGDDAGLGIVDAQGNRQRLPLGRIRYINHRPQWSPDGTRIAFTGIP